MAETGAFRHGPAGYFSVTSKSAGIAFLPVEDSSSNRIVAFPGAAPDGTPTEPS